MRTLFSLKKFLCSVVVFTRHRRWTSLVSLSLSSYFFVRFYIYMSLFYTAIDLLNQKRLRKWKQESASLKIKFNAVHFRKDSLLSGTRAPQLQTMHGMK